MTLRTLYQALLDGELARLRVIARQWDIPLTAQLRTDLAAELADAMARAEAVQSAWEALPAQGRAALEDLLRRGGSLPWPAFTRRWGLLRAVGPGRLEREELWRTPISATEVLWYRGFLHRFATVTEAGTPLELAFVPEDLSLYLPVPSPLAIPPPDPAPAPVQVSPGDDSLAGDLVTFWSFLQNETVRQTEDGSWPDKRRETLLARLHDPAESRLRLLETLAEEQGWIWVDERGLLRPAPDPMLAWLRADRWAQWEALAEAWRESQAWKDIRHVPGLEPDPALAWPADARGARRNFLELLLRCTPGIWYTFADLIAYVKEYMPDFLRLDGNYEGWSPRDAVTQELLRGFGAWGLVEGRLLSFYLLGPLAWLGLVDLGRALPSLPPDRFRLSEAGEAVFQAGSPPTFLEPPPVELRRDGVLVVPAARRYERFQVSRIAWSVGDGVPERFRLTPRSLARARRQNISLERIQEFLEEATGGALPMSLRQGLERAYRTGEEVRLSRGWILRVLEPELLEYESVRVLLQERLGPRVALVREADRERLLALLAGQGVLPNVEENP